MTDHSKRSPDEPMGRANARPMTGSATYGSYCDPAYGCAHATENYLTISQKMPTSATKAKVNSMVRR
jgi:hypothetical protein